MVDIFHKIYKEYTAILNGFPWVVTLAEVVSLFIFAWLINILFRKIILKIAERNASTEAYIKNKS